jgi:hypothetical protein
MNNLGITVIIASYLGEYPGSRSNPVQKFIRAVKSFQQQTLKEKQLIIVSDGCGLTNAVYEDLFKSDSQITLIRFEKQEGWPGPLREAARTISKYDWIMYLDSDNFITKNYLENIAAKITINNNKQNWFGIKRYLLPIENGLLNDNHVAITKYDKGILENYLSDFFFDESTNKKYKTIVVVFNGYYDTFQIVHHKDCSIKWEKKIEVGEDKDFIEKVKNKYNLIDINVIGYHMCHFFNRLENKIMLDF